ncbi:hypothetical protein [Streptomyces sp. NPDC087300]|uniref:hypothetical protein n=1 Tax=Streptomyces sp. NPDC087300 TaxID=3365780 RepID=UPI0037F7A32F
MDAELTALAAAGATALVQQMVTDGWTRARDGVAALFSRDGGSGGSGDVDDEVLVGELEEARAEVVAARDSGDEEIADDVRTEWRSRLRRRLAADPEAVVELRALLAELEEGEGGAAVGGVTYNNSNHLSGGEFHGTVIQAQNIGRTD